MLLFFFYLSKVWVVSEASTDLYEPTHTHLEQRPVHTRFSYVRSKVKRCHLQDDVNCAWRRLGGRSTRRHNTPHVLLHSKRGSVFLLVVIPHFLLSVQISQKYVKCLCWFNWCSLRSYVNWSRLEMKRLVNTSLAGHKGGINYLQVENRLVFNRPEQLFLLVYEDEKISDSLLR